MRVRRAPVTRLSRKVLLGLGAAAALGIGGALFLALKPQHRTAGSELYDTNNRNTPDGLATLPKDYTGLPKSTPQLGPPLPGDLGRPILNAGAPVPVMSMPAAGSSPEEQRIAQEQEAARVSHLFATTNVALTGAAPSPLPAAAQPTSGRDKRGIERSDLPGSQARLPERARRSANHQSRSSATAGQSQRAASWRGHSGLADHRAALRPAWPSNRPGDRRRL